MAIEAAFRSEEVFTQAEFWQWVQRRPDSDHNRYELLGGHIVMSPLAGWPHGGIEAGLIGLLSAHVSARKLGLMLGSSTGYDLPSGDTLEPDVSFISTERLAAGPAPERGRFLRIVPNLVVEILSDSTAKRDRGEKLEIYARNGVDECWLVDTKQREIAVHFRAGDGFGPAVVITGGQIPSRVLAGLDARFEDLFADPF
jgi:Uma2 family endonuclease